MKRFFNVFFSIILVMLMIGLSACSNDKANPYDELRINNDSSIAVGQQILLDIETYYKGERVTLSNALDYEYQISDETVVSLNDDILEGLKAGNATITISTSVCSTSLDIQCYAKVKEIELPDFEGVALNTPYAIEAVVLPSAVNTTVQYSVTGNGVTLKDNTLTFTAYGSFTLTARVERDNYTVSKDYTITPAEPKSIAMNLSNTTFVVGETYELVSTVSPKGCDQRVTYTTSDSSIARIDNHNVISFLKAGKVSITAYSMADNNICLEVNVTVVSAKPATIEVTSDRSVVRVGQTAQLTSVIAPSEASQAVTYSSSDSSIATVSSKGIVTFKAQGKVVISAKTSNNLTATVTYDVLAKEDDITLDYQDGLTDASTNVEILEAIVNFLKVTYDNQEVTRDVNFITSYKSYKGLTFDYESDNDDVLTSTGVFKQPVIDTTVKISVIVLSTSGGVVSRSCILNMNCKGWGNALDAAEFKVKDSIPSDYTVTTVLPTEYEGATISYISSEPEVISATGFYKKPFVDTQVTLNYTITYNNETRTGSVQTTAIGYTDYQLCCLIQTEYNTKYEAEINNKNITGDIDLINTSDIYPATIYWVSSADGIINCNGVFTKPVYTANISLTVHIMIGSQEVQSTYTVKVNQGTFTDMWDKIETFLENIHKDTITNQEYTAYGFESGYTQMIQRDYGFMYFYTNTDPEIIDGMLSYGGNRPGNIQTKTWFITIHDTATGSPWANAAGMNTYVHSTECVEGDKSWHFSVGNDGIYQHIPTNEFAYHAGDGAGSGSEFTLLDTGLMATSSDPTITIGEDGYYYLDGQKSKLAAPRRSDGSICRSMTSSGIFNMVGSNGHWFIDQTYYNSSYGVIANHGGNRNSISMETCINYGSDYTLTMYNIAKLTAWLCDNNNLDITRVKQHNYWSGKDCPETMRHSGRWELLLDMISLELFGRQELKGVDFEWTSLSPSIMNNQGRIINYAGAGVEVSYKVKVTYQGVSKEYTFTSRLARLTFDK